MRPLKPETKREIESTARLIMGWSTAQLPTFGDSMMAISLATAGLIWGIQQKDEQQVRDIMAKTTEAVVAAWKEQKRFVEEQHAGIDGTQVQPGQ